VARGTANLISDPTTGCCHLECISMIPLPLLIYHENLNASCNCFPGLLQCSPR